MTIPADMAAMADDIMATLGVPATYRAGGAGDGVAVTVRCKPRRRMTNASRTFLLMEISVRATEVSDPQFGDTFEIGPDVWSLSSLPLEFYEITDHAMGALWQLALTRDARPTLRGGTA